MKVSADFVEWNDETVELYTDRVMEGLIVETKGADISRVNALTDVEGS